MIFIGFFYHTVQILFFSNEDFGFISLISLPKWENISILHSKLFFDVEIYLFWCSCWYMVVRKCGNVLWVTNVHWYAWQHPNHIVKSEMSQYLARNTKKNSFMVYPSISYYVNFILSNIWAIFNFSSFI